VIGRGHEGLLVSSWVEPVDAEAAVQADCRFLVQPCLEPPTRGRVERFKRDILPLLLTRQAAERLPASPRLPTVSSPSTGEAIARATSCRSWSKGHESRDEPTNCPTTGNGLVLR
jgi:hypothetical protein